MNPRSRPFFVSSKENYFKDNVKNTNWVGHSQLISLDIDDLFERKPVVDDIQASVTGNTMNQSDYENNPDLLQEEEEQES